MCRMAAFPPGTSQKEALFVLSEFVGENDGTGVAYVKDGTFVVHKYALPLDAVVARKLPLLGHMPHNGWTIAHLRTASVGKVQRDNSHPFIKGNWAVCHNGTFTGDAMLRAVYKRMGFRFSGTTDSEVLAQTISHIGFPAFSKVVEDGAFFGLHRSGDLFVKVSEGSDMEMVRTKHGLILGSEIPAKFKKRKTIDGGWARLSKTSRKLAGKMTGHATEDYGRYYEANYGAASYGGYYGESVTYKDWPKVGKPKATVRSKPKADWDEDDYEDARIKELDRSLDAEDARLVDAYKAFHKRSPKGNGYREETYMGYYD